MEAVNKTHWSEENSVTLIQKLRNDLLKDFLDERFLKEYIDHHFNVRELSNIKIEFIKKDLKELYAAPIDMAHYDPLLINLKETDSAALENGNDQLFYSEIDKVLKRYVY
jgi:hypothetical protein